VEKKSRRTLNILFNQKGFTLFVLLATIVIIGISTSIGVKQWKTIVKRDKEAELLFRGDQIRRAIALYFNKPGALKYPSSMEDLMGDGFGKKNYLRRLYKDPMTKKDFELLGVNNVIVGVRSTSDDLPLKTGEFPDAYQCFEEAETYRDWLFLYIKSAKNEESPCAAIVNLKVIEK
jgi:type II secretory pathway pseudopilin PulG